LPIIINGETYLTTKEALTELGIRRETLSRYIRKGRIASYTRGFERTSYFKESDVKSLKEVKNTIVPRSTDQDRE
jgi:excisionase family DNA binding protein